MHHSNYQRTDSFVLAIAYVYASLSRLKLSPAADDLVAKQLTRYAVGFNTQISQGTGSHRNAS